MKEIGQKIYEIIDLQKEISSLKKILLKCKNPRKFYVENSFVHLIDVFISIFFETFFYKEIIWIMFLIKHIIHKKIENDSFYCIHQKIRNLLEKQKAEKTLYQNINGLKNIIKYGNILN